MIKILLIDDDDNYSFFMKESLKKTGEFEVILSNSGDDGIEKARKLRPDIILLDLMMPEKSGFDVAAELKKMKATRTIPFIFLTGIIKEDAIKEYQHIIGKNYYLTKSADISELLKIVDTLLKNRENSPEYESKSKVRIVTHVTRDKVDFLDRLGKDVLFSKGYKLSRAAILEQLIELLQRLEPDIKNCDLSHGNLASSILRLFGKE